MKAEITSYSQAVVMNKVTKNMHWKKASNK